MAERPAADAAAELRRAKDRVRKAKYRAENKGKLKAYFARYYVDNADVMKGNANRWRRGNVAAARSIRDQYDERHPEQYAARCAVARAVARGELTREPCEVCGSKRSQAHHDDYSLPISVRWLCPKHHAQADAQRRAREASAKAVQP